MSRLYRTLKTDCWISESMGRLTRDARLLFVGLITQCDDAGRMRAALRVIAAAVFPFDGVTDQELEAWLCELEREEMIVRYEVNRTMYIAVVNWEKHQVIDRPTKSRIPEPPRNEVLETSRGLSSALEDSRGGADGVREGEGIGGGGEGERADGSASTPPPQKATQDQGTAKDQSKTSNDRKKNYVLLVNELKLNAFCATKEAVEEWMNGTFRTAGCKTPDDIFRLIRFCRENHPTARYFGQCVDSGLCEAFKGILIEERRKKDEGDLKEAV